MAKLFDSLRETFRSKLKQPAREQNPSRRGGTKDRTSAGSSIEKEAEQAPPERVGEIVGHSSGG